MSHFILHESYPHSEGITQSMCEPGDEDLKGCLIVLLTTCALDKSEMLKKLLEQVR